MVPGYDIPDAVAVRWSTSYKALLVRADFFPKGTKWVPTSQITSDSEVRRPGDIGELCITEWLAIQEGWL